MREWDVGGEGEEISSCVEDLIQAIFALLNEYHMNQ